MPYMRYNALDARHLHIVESIFVHWLNQCVTSHIVRALLVKPQTRYSVSLLIFYSAGFLNVIFSQNSRDSFYNSIFCLLYTSTFNHIIISVNGSRFNLYTPNKCLNTHKEWYGFLNEQNCEPCMKVNTSRIILSTFFIPLNWRFHRIQSDDSRQTILSTRDRIISKWKEWQPFCNEAQIETDILSSEFHAVVYVRVCCLNENDHSS